MKSSYLATPRATNQIIHPIEITSSPATGDQSMDYDTPFEEWTDTSEGAPARRGKGKIYQLISSSSDHSVPSPPSDKDSDYEPPKGTLFREDATEEDFSQGAPGGRTPAIPPSPESSPEPYVHPPIEEWEEDVDWSEYGDMELSSTMVEEIKKNRGKLNCVDQPSTLSWEELEWTMDYYDQKGTAVVPLEEMRAHRFDIGNCRIPRMVLTPRHISLGAGVPLHPYFEQILEWFDIAPIQLSPNSYKLAAGLYILYKEEGYGAPSMEELSFFFRLTKNSPGYFYLTIRSQHRLKGFGEGRASHVKRWRDPFFYVYNTKRMRTQFNISPGKNTLFKVRPYLPFLH